MQKVIVKRDSYKTSDLGGNVTEIKFYDVDGYAYTLTRVPSSKFVRLLPREFSRG
jgi:hypothetical protein